MESEFEKMFHLLEKKEKGYGRVVHSAKVLAGQAMVKGDELATYALVNLCERGKVSLADCLALSNAKGADLQMPPLTGKSLFGVWWHE